MLAGLIACAALAATVLSGARPGAPEPPLLPADQGVPLRLALIGLTAIGFLVALRWARVGGLVAATGALSSGALAAFELHPALAALAGAVPLALAGALATRGAGRRAAIPAVAIMALAVAVGLVTWRGHTLLYGATHPASAVPGPPAGLVRWVWSGGVTGGEATVVAKLTRATGVADLRVAPSARVTVERSGPIARFHVTGLRPGAVVTYAVTVDGREDGSGRGRFRTAPVGPASFTVAFSSCARSGSNGAVFDAIRARDPLRYLNLGDLYYANIDRNRPERFRAAFDQVLTRPAQANLVRAVASDYVWDDHDFGPNDADATSASAAAAHAVFRELVPHHSLGLSGPQAPVAHAFTLGRVRFVVTDTRSARSPKDADDGASKTMLGSAQRAWLFGEFAAARDRGELVVWVNPDPWIGVAEAGADGWAGYATERRTIADFVVQNGIALVMLSGDNHAVAIDDGTNSGYATGGARGFPVAHGGALDRAPQQKGGPYSHGYSSGGGRYGTMRVDDRGGPSIGVTLSGWDWRGRRLVNLQTTITLPAARGSVSGG